MCENKALTTVICIDNTYVTRDCDMSLCELHYNDLRDDLFMYCVPAKFMPLL